MAKVRAANPPSATKRTRPALNPDAREQQLIALAVDLVEERLKNGTASSQETTHFLKLASREARLKQARAEQEIELMKAKTSAIRSGEETAKVYAEAIAAMKQYSGHGGDDDYDEDY